MIDFNSLYQHYAQDVYRFSLYLCGDPAYAEELSTEAFARAWTTPGDIREGTVKAYLFMIVRNLYRAGLKQEKHHTELDVDLPDQQPGPEALSAARLELQTTLNTLQTLPELERAILLMHAQDEMSYAEIAAVLGLSVAAVKVKVHRSRIKLNQLLRKETK
jgi:RNA polymerase sigma-70 factor (ECF subfamily)